MKFQKKALWEWLLIGVCLLGGYWALQLRLDSTRLGFSKDAKAQNSAELYLPSPIERKILDRVQKLWPGRYDPSNPPVSKDWPSIYTFLERHPYEFSELSELELQQARIWSFIINSGRPGNLLSLLDYAKNLSQIAAWPATWKIDGLCHPLRQELLYRLLQASKDIDAQKYLEALKSCDAKNPVVLWAQYQRARDPKTKEQITHEIKKLSLDPALGAYSRWLAEEFFNVIFLFGKN